MSIEALQMIPGHDFVIRQRLLQSQNHLVTAGAASSSPVDKERQFDVVSQDLFVCRLLKEDGTNMLLKGQKRKSDAGVSYDQKG